MTVNALRLCAFARNQNQELTQLVPIYRESSTEKAQSTTEEK